MKVSALICSLWVDDRKPQILNKCIKKLKGADEILSLVTEPNTRLGFADSWNRLAKIATGDYLIFIGDSAYLKNGNLKDLCIPDTITFPLVNDIYSTVIFCMPRNIYDKIGLYDISFNEGVHYEDLDFWRNVLNHRIKYQGVKNVNFYKLINGRSINKIQNMNELEEHNKSIYIKKWGDSYDPKLNIPQVSNFKTLSYFLKIRGWILEFPFVLKGILFNYKKKLEQK